jgi:c-di-GMP-binding flagellar brake protein YcgR
VYNQRKSFRVPFEQEIDVHIHALSEDSMPLLYEELPIKETISVLLSDISFGGVKLIIDQNFEDRKADILLRFSCAFPAETLQLQGRFRHIAFLPDEKKWSHGVQFINLPALAEQKIFQHVLDLERELLKPEE